MILPDRDTFIAALRQKLADTYIPHKDIPEAVVELMDEMGLKLPKGTWPGYRMTPGQSGFRTRA